VDVDGVVPTGDSVVDEQVHDNIPDNSTSIVDVLSNGPCPLAVLLNSRTDSAAFAAVVPQQVVPSHVHLDEDPRDKVGGTGRRRRQRGEIEEKSRRIVSIRARRNCGKAF
jgi:hypothetical protein